MARTIDPRRIEAVDDEMAAVYRLMSPSQRATIASEAHRSARVIVQSVVRQSHPEWSDDAVRIECLRRLLDDGSVGISETHR